MGLVSCFCLEEPQQPGRLGWGRGDRTIKGSSHPTCQCPGASPWPGAPARPVPVAGQDSSPGRLAARAQDRSQLSDRAPRSSMSGGLGLGFMGGLLWTGGYKSAKPIQEQRLETDCAVCHMEPPEDASQSSSTPAEASSSRSKLDDRAVKQVRRSCIPSEHERRARPAQMPLHRSVTRHRPWKS